jgi:hypothetical protein
MADDHEEFQDHVLRRFEQMEETIEHMRHRILELDMQVQHLSSQVPSVELGGRVGGGVTPSMRIGLVRFGAAAKGENVSSSLANELGQEAKISPVYAADVDAVRTMDKTYYNYLLFVLNDADAHQAAELRTLVSKRLPVSVMVGGSSDENMRSVAQEIRSRLSMAAHPQTLLGVKNKGAYFDDNAPIQSYKDFARHVKEKLSKKDFAMTAADIQVLKKDTERVKTLVASLWAPYIYRKYGRFNDIQEELKRPPVDNDTIVDFLWRCLGKDNRRSGYWMVPDG